MEFELDNYAPRTIAMLKFRSRPFRAGLLQSVVGGALKSAQVMLSGLTHFCGSIGANGLVGELWRGSTIALATLSSEALMTAIEATESFWVAIMDCVLSLKLEAQLSWAKQGHERYARPYLFGTCIPPTKGFQAPPGIICLPFMTMAKLLSLSWGRLDELPKVV